MSSDGVAQQVAQLAQALLQRRERLATAESCTGGLVAAACTDLAGSSQWFDRGFVTYSNEAKQDQLGVPASLLAQYGAVSEPVARRMAEGALAHAQAQWSVAITGIAGPTGGSADKPVGTVWMAWAHSGGSGQNATVECQRFQFSGDRAEVRQGALEAALSGLVGRLADARA